VIEFIGDMAFQRPDFIHEFGHGDHHTSLMRTVELDEDGQYIPYTGEVPEWRYEVHDLLDHYVFYPISKWLIDHDGSSFERIAGAVLKFFWGLNCCFPRKDVLLYTIWYLRGCPAVRWWKKIDGEWQVQT
jgi:hypothetical protein